MMYIVGLVTKSYLAIKKLLYFILKIDKISYVTNFNVYLKKNVCDQKLEKHLLINQFVILIVCCILESNANLKVNLKIILYFCFTKRSFKVILLFCPV